MYRVMVTVTFVVLSIALFLHSSLALLVGSSSIAGILAYNLYITRQRITYDKYNKAVVYVNKYVFETDETSYDDALKGITSILKNNNADIKITDKYGISYIRPSSLLLIFSVTFLFLAIGFTDQTYMEISLVFLGIYTAVCFYKRIV